ncbi:unnamed protein product [Linum tenue]|uniref:Uncharacterized protein n=1 Tax=Linum tenue TaxID=586396 RepID=A0AAV0Q0P8_9ROSI|nr:unnamed protein product [Linum tenue]
MLFVVNKGRRRRRRKKANRGRQDFPLAAVATRGWSKVRSESGGSSQLDSRARKPEGGGGEDIGWTSREQWRQI